MLSRVACVPRVCLSCRLGLFQIKAAALSVPAALSCRDRRIRRYHDNRDSVIQSKERIEALISGRLTENKEKRKEKQPSKRRGSRSKTTKGKAKAESKSKSKSKSTAKSKRDKDEDLPDWGFSFSKDRKGVKAQIEKKENVVAQNLLVEEPIKIKEPVVQEPQISEPEILHVEAPEPQLEESQQEVLQIEQPRLEEFEIEAAVQDNLEPSKAETTSQTKSILARRRHRRKYQDELVQSRFLGKQALGRPLDALVVKNPNKMKKLKKPIRMLEEEKMAKAVDLHWQALMPKMEEHGDLMNEAMQNIEALQPVDTTILSTKDFDDLQNELVVGYTYNQLVAYFHRKLKKLDTQRNEPRKYDWIIEQTPWEPSQPDHWEKSTPKFNYAIMIIRRIWNIEIKEQVEGLGRLQIWLRPEFFKLISGPTSPVLRSLAAKYLYKSNKERVEGSVDESRLDIFARKSIIPVILARLDEVASSITLQKVSAKDLIEEDLTPNMLQEVARITGTLIHHDAKDAELQVSWLANDGRLPSIANRAKTSSQTETPADIMLRLLMGRQTKAREQQTSLQILTRLEENEPDGCRFITHQRETRSMSWREKLQSWFRYVSPIGKLPLEDAKPAAGFYDKISLPKSVAKAPGPDATTNMVTATFGHILHDKANAKKKQMAQNLRILSPVVPHPAALTPITRETVKPISQQTSIILNFTPSFSTPQTTTTKTKTKTTTKATQKPAGHVPELQLRLPVNPDADLSNFSLPTNSTLHGILHRHVHDVLLPGESVDVRLTRHALLPLDVEKQPLKEFIASCDFNLLEGRLRTPSQTSFSIPSSWIPSTRGRKSRKPVDVTYQFMGLELHQVVEVEWRGHTLKYNSIEAGQHGGQRQELSLQAGPQEETQFFQLVRDLATGKHFSWHEGYKSMREKHSKDVSFDALEEYEDADGEEALSPKGISALEEEQEQHIPFSTENENTTAEESAVEKKDVVEYDTTENNTETNVVSDASSHTESQSDTESSSDTTKVDKNI